MILKKLKPETVYKVGIKVLKKLRNAGFKTYFVGGAVRDILLKKSFSEIDLATSAKPEEIQKIFKKVIPVGKDFGVVIVNEERINFEVATFRKESGYLDGRRPSKIVYTDEQEDVKRRDFTINGMFFDPENKQLFDFVSGEQDLKKKIIRFIGNPEERIQDDHLRILRAIRFKNCLDFEYEEKTKLALMKYPQLLEKISKERIREELVKMMLDKNRHKCLQDLNNFGILEIILPEIKQMIGVEQPKEFHLEGDVFTHTCLVLKSLGKYTSKELAISALFHDIGKPKTFNKTDRIHFYGHEVLGEKITRTILQKYKFSRKEIKKICWLIRNHMIFGNILKMRPGKRNYWFCQEYFKDLIKLFKADIKGSRPLNIDFYQQIYNLYREYKGTFKKPLKKLVSGEEIMQFLKISPGKKIGEIIKKITEKQLSLEIKTKNDALKFLQTLKKS